MNKRGARTEPWWSVTTLLLAAEEAVRSNHSEIEPVHLLIGVCRLAGATPQDGDVASAEDHARLCAEFEAFGIPPQKFRQRLRALVSKGRCTDALDVIRRAVAERSEGQPGGVGVLSGTICSAASRMVIIRAGQLAGVGRAPGARHLLRALLIGDMSDAAVPPTPADKPDGLPDRL